VVSATVQVRRVYEEPAPDDGLRILVDRLWPRGLAKDEANLDEWVTAVAPSNELRTWYGHSPDRYDEFRRRYLSELREPDHAAALDHLHQLAKRASVTLLTATKDPEHSQAAVLAELLRGGGAGRT
jgi:uncharacterized protein YeaO (DUF488 family)